MTQQETKEHIISLTNTLIQKKCYIKGFGDKFRICDEHHNPVMNIPKHQFEILVENNIVRREGLIHVLNVAANPFKHYLEVKLPIKA